MVTQADGRSDGNADGNVDGQDERQADGRADGTAGERLVARFGMNAADPAVLGGLEGGWLEAMVMRKEYTSGITGSAVLHFAWSGSSDTDRGYLAAERITGTLDDGRTGEFTVHHGALADPADPSAWGYIIPGSGTGDFAAFRGQARIHHDDAGAYFVFDLELPRA